MALICDSRPTDMIDGIFRTSLHTTRHLRPHAIYCRPIPDNEYQ